MKPLLLLAVVLASGCTQAFFYPDRILIDTPRSYGLDYEPVQFSAADDTELFGWFLPAQSKPRATVLYLHGNAQNISAHFPAVAWLPAAGYNVLAMDYRGYGRSDGKPSLAGMQLDIDAGMQFLLSRSDVDSDKIFIVGQSLGAALAISYVARSRYRSHVRAVVADSPFSDYRLIGREKLAANLITWPLQWLPSVAVDNGYSPAAAVRALSPIPLLLMHGDGDVVVPVHHSQRLFELAAEPKDLWVIPDAGHLQAMRSRATQQKLAEFLDRHSK